MINKYKEKFMVWQLHYRTEIVCVVAGFIAGAIIFQFMTGDFAYGLQIYSNTDNIVMFTGYICKAGILPIVENR